MSEPTVFGVGYYPSRLAEGQIVFLGVAGVDRDAVRKVAAQAWASCRPEEEARRLIQEQWPGHTYWIEVEDETGGTQEYGTMEERSA